MDEASRLHFGKFNASKFTQFHNDGLDEVSSTLHLKKQLCHKMWPKMTKARFKRRTLHVPNLMQMRKIYCFRSFALDLAHEKFDV